MSETKKLGVDIPIELSDSLDQVIPWGMKSRIVNEILVLLNASLQAGGQQVIADLLEGKMQLRSVRNSDMSGDGHE